jgi:general secretion pathway protein G
MRRTIEILLKRRRARAELPRGLRDRGMTLLEIMIVLALIALVTLALVKGILPMFLKGKQDVAKLAVGKMGGIIEIYKSHNDGKCPSIDDLIADGLLVKAESKDPWGQPYMIKDCLGTEGAHVVSNGPDRQEGTADDIKNAE